MRKIWNGAALAAILALVAVAALQAGAPAPAKAAPAAAKTAGGKFADRLPSTLPAPLASLAPAR